MFSRSESRSGNVHLRLAVTSLPFWQADNHGASLRKFLIRYFRRKLQLKSSALAFEKRRIVKEINDISTKPVLHALAFVQVERTSGIHFQLPRLGQGGAKHALKLKPSGPHLRHGESENVVSHKT